MPVGFSGTRRGLEQCPGSVGVVALTGMSWAVNSDSRVHSLVASGRRQVTGPFEPYFPQQ